MSVTPRAWVLNRPAPHHSASEDAAFSLPAAAGGVWWAAVADGVGSAPGGRLASAAAVAATECWTRQGPPGRGRLDALFRAAALRLADLERDDVGLRGLATTLTVLGLAADAVWVAHMGDCRLYRANRAGVCRLTADHRLEPDGQPFLTRAVTAAGTHRPDVARLPAPEPGELLLLCTDGVWSAAEPGALESALLLGAERTTRFLLDLAERRRDDFCCVLLNLGPGTANREPFAGGCARGRTPTRPLDPEGGGAP